MQACTGCHTVPQSDDDVALAFMLTDRFLDKDKLTAAAKMIRSGQRIELPPAVRAAVLAALQGARAQRPTQQQGIGARGWGAIAAIAVVLFLIFHPWPHFQWSSFRDTASSYEAFAARFPSSDFTSLAKERLRVLKEDEIWSAADGSGQIETLRSYIRVYPDGKHFDEAKRQTTSIADQRWQDISKSESKTEIQRFTKDYPETTKIAAAEARVIEIADKKWSAISKSRSLTEIRNFLTAFPETTKATDADARIQLLFNDFDWVKEQDSLEHYRRFATRYPSHAQIAAIEKRIIDLEVKEIAAGEYGEMPKAQALSYGGTSTDVDVENKTGYELTVRYSGPSSKKLVIPVGATRSVALVPGAYQVAASVNAADVTNYFGSDTMQGGRYSSSFFIQSSYGGSSFSVPSFTPERRRR
jgi:hypothetical protein